MRRIGFTLIELLVVIAIIAILAAILFPVFARAREKARQSSCLSNIKQLCLAVQQYTSDYDEMFVPAITYPPAYSNILWSGMVLPYVKNEQIFACPSATNHKFTPIANSDRGSMSIGYNWYFQTDVGRDLSLPGMEYPSAAVILGDTNNGPAADGYRGYMFSMSNSPSGRQCGTLQALLARHNEGANLGFADGHAKWMTESAINGRQGIYLWGPDW
ncbi:MAG: DUF1559 domain-containing protein [Armatimonadota bacterium]